MKYTYDILDEHGIYVADAERYFDTVEETKADIQQKDYNHYILYSYDEENDLFIEQIERA